MTWSPEVWSSQEFLDDLREWISPHVGEVRSLERVKDRPWAAVWRVDAAAGVHYVKQNCPAQQQEARVLSVLSRVAPEHVVAPVAVDVRRDLTLTADQGRVLRDLPEHDRWAELLRDAMLLSRASASHLDELALTTIDPAEAREYVERARDGWRIPDEFREGVDAALTSAGDAGEELASLGLPLALNHNDLHDANVFAPEGRLRFFDFGDSVASSPLAALRIPLEGYARRLGTDVADARVRAAADAALEVWSDLAPMSQLRASLPAAWRIAALGRAESWHRILSTVPERFVEEDYHGADADWLAEAAV
ncbi:hypothetical protein DY023_02565 [Microbacterium bovistercoris]|uniref:Aminoglycoside phosphotransferase domain-containing protein n=1 Tax=Microbacterium bovistercoris TaxID=2293570 RepID=A0A371NXC5_9MICO|nr:hypothetical protein [Microbacterium bovistercoris]REJ07867.1 hypothetical protein DY023_02565 [Microbacterium bovistercoris]